jgi:hypothetical protein
VAYSKVLSRHLPGETEKNHTRNLVQDSRYPGQIRTEHGRVLDGGEWLTSRTGFSTPGKKALRYLLHRRLGGPRRRSEHCTKEKNLLPSQGIEAAFHGCPSSSPSLYRLSYPGFYRICQFPKKNYSLYKN